MATNTIQYIATCLTKGIAKSEIAKRLGISRPTLYAKIKKTPELEKIQYRNVLKREKTREKEEKDFYAKHKRKPGETSNILWTRQKRLFQFKRRNANLAGIPFSVTLKDLVFPEKCPILGITINYFSPKLSMESASFDRYLPTKGYVPGNVRIISFRANLLKSNCTDYKELRKIRNYAESNKIPRKSVQLTPTQEDRIRKMLRQAKSKSKMLGLPFDLTFEDLVFPKRCPALGIILNYETGSAGEEALASLDRHNPSKGYVWDNVRIISFKANRIKNNGTAQELYCVEQSLR